jgi:ubiquinone/menaquinone biosynthesis C-methylase UbiE
VLPVETKLKSNVVDCVVAAPSRVRRQAASAIRLIDGEVQFIVGKAEETGLPDKSFDVITSSMSWGYLDQKKMPEEAARLLRESGLLLISSLNWVRDADAITRHTGELLKEYGSEQKTPAQTGIGMYSS